MAAKMDGKVFKNNLWPILNDGLQHFM